jgi:hypothetical protein
MNPSLAAISRTIGSAMVAPSLVRCRSAKNSRHFSTVMVATSLME